MHRARGKLHLLLKFVGGGGGRSSRAAKAKNRRKMKERLCAPTLIKPRAYGPAGFKVPHASAPARGKFQQLRNRKQPRQLLRYEVTQREREKAVKAALARGDDLSGLCLRAKLARGRVREREREARTRTRIPLIQAKDVRSLLSFGEERERERGGVTNLLRTERATDTSRRAVRGSLCL